MSIRIICQQPGFRRAGVVHQADATWPADAFSAEQLVQLLAEPKLVVTAAEDTIEALLAEAGRLSIEAMASLRREILAGGETNTPVQPATPVVEDQQAQPEADAVVEPIDGAAEPADGTQTAPTDPGSGPVPSETGEVSDVKPAKASEAAPPKKSRKG